MTGWTSVARLWPGSLATMAIPLPNCGNCRTILDMSALRVELFFDEEAARGHYRVPARTSTAGAP